jgi:dTMP kinase
VTKPPPENPASPQHYIAVEGIDGTGKSTLIAAIAAHLRSQHHTVLTTEEPTRGVHGKTIREHLGSKSKTLTGAQWLDLFEADRREHMETTVKPALARGEFVVSDRSFYSTAAYQGAQGENAPAILARNRSFAVEPGLVIILDLDPATSLARVARRRGMEADAFERRDFLERVAANFAAMTGPNIVHVDAAKSPEVVAADAIAAINARFTPRFTRFSQP